MQVIFGNLHTRDRRLQILFFERILKLAANQEDQESTIQKREKNVVNQRKAFKYRPAFSQPIESAFGVQRLKYVICNSKLMRKLYLKSLLRLPQTRKHAIGFFLVPSYFPLSRGSDMILSKQCARKKIAFLRTVSRPL